MTSIANATLTMASSAQGQESHGIHGLHLLSTVVDTFLHGNVQNQKNSPSIPIETRHYGIPRMSLPLVSACSSPTENTFNSNTHIYSSLREKARIIGKLKSAIPVRVSRPKASSFRSALLTSRSKLSPHLSVNIATAEDLKLEKPNLVPPSPPSYLQEFSNHQTIQELFIQQAQGLMEKQTFTTPLSQERTNGLLYAPILKVNDNEIMSKACSGPASTKVSVTAFMANGERVVSKKSMAELNYIKHKAVPMREKWMARFLELAEFKEKYGHTKVPHNFPDSPKLAEWQVRQYDHCCCCFRLTVFLVMLQNAWPLTISLSILLLQKFQRQQRKLFVKGKHSQLTPERVVMLEKIGFVWEARIDAWESHYQNLKRFKESHGHIYVPVANTVLSQWVKRQRKQYKKYEKGQESSLTQDRVDRLNKLGFIWDGRHLTD